VTAADEVLHRGPTLHGRRGPGSGGPRPSMRRQRREKLGAWRTIGRRRSSLVSWKRGDTGWQGTRRWQALIARHCCIPTERPSSGAAAHHMPWRFLSRDAGVAHWWTFVEEDEVTNCSSGRCPLQTRPSGTWTTPEPGLSYGRRPTGETPDGRDARRERCRSGGHRSRQQGWSGGTDDDCGGTKMSARD